MEERYTSYTAVQLAGEPAFIRWVQSGEQAMQWQTWAEQHPENGQTLKIARRMVLDASRLPAPAFSSGEKSALWAKIEVSAGAVSQNQSVRRVKPLYWWTLAAAASLALLFWINQAYSTRTVMAMAGQQKEITLPEGSLVRLNAGSSVAYSKNRFARNREVRFEGEAFFQVTHGSRFNVITPQGKVTVLGTSFNVISRKERFEVSCYTGKVRVENSTASSQTITPGQRCQNDARQGKLLVTAFAATSDAPEWTNGKFVFNDQPLREVADELERQYNIQVRLEPGLEQMRYTGLFESGNLDQALSLITWPLHLQAKTQNDTVSIVR